MQFSLDWNFIYFQTIKMTGKIILFSILLFWGSFTIAQEGDRNLAVDLTIRPRAEFRNGSFTLKESEDDPAFFISQRTRLRILFGISRLKIGVSGQNIRVWGESGQIAPKEGNNTMLNEAWAEYEFLKGLSMRVGRQSLVYDDERILGRLDWNQAGRWHDLALIKYETDGHRLHVGLAYSQDQENKLNNFYSAPGDNYKTMQMIWYENIISERMKYSLLFMNTGFQVKLDSSMANLQTFGGNFYKTDDPLTLTATLYCQTGKNAVRQRVKAFMASVYGNYKIVPRWAIHAGMDFLSGRDMDAVETMETGEFVPLYGTNHKFYGLMDYFYTGVSHNQSGLWDKYLGTSWNPTQDLSLKLTGHFFNSTAKVVSTEKKGSYLGTELDLTFAWDLIKGVYFLGGYSQMFATESMEIVKERGDHSLFHNWIWAMFVVDVRIFEWNK